MDRQKKYSQINVAYDKDADVLYLSEGRPRKAICQMLSDGIVVRKDPKTSKVIGFTILDFISHFSKPRPRSLPFSGHFSVLRTS